MPVTGFLLSKSELNKIIHLINTPSSVRNIFAGRAGPRSIPSPLCPGTHVLAPSCGRIHRAALIPSVHMVLGLSDLCLQKRGDAHSQYGGCRTARIPGHRGPVLGSSCLITSRCGCTLLGVSLPLHLVGSLGVDFNLPGQSCPPFHLHPPIF